MKKWLLNLALCSFLTATACGPDIPGPAGPQGPSGVTGAPGIPGSVPGNVTLLTPSSGFVGRTMQVQIFTIGTMLKTNAPALTFSGTGVTASGVTINGDDNIIATVTIANNAAFTARDVTVSSGSMNLTLTGAFTVKPEIVAQGAAPIGQQGGLVAINFRNDDYLANPFYRASFGSGSLTGLINGFTSFDYSRVFGFALIDALASTAAAIPQQFSGLDSTGAAVTYCPNAADAALPMVTSRAATALTSGTPVSGDFTAALASNLYSFNNGAANNVLVVKLSSLGAAYSYFITSFTGAQAPSNGVFKSGQPFNVFPTGPTSAVGLALLPTTSTNYFTLYPTNLGGSGGGGYGYMVDFVTLPGTSFSAAERALPDYPASMPIRDLGALANATARYATDGKIDYVGDVDFINYRPMNGGTVMVQVYSPTDPDAALSINYAPVAGCTNPSAPSAFSGTNSMVAHPVLAGMNYCLQITGTGRTYPLSYQLIVAKD